MNVTLIVEDVPIPVEIQMVVITVSVLIIMLFNLTSSTALKVSFYFICCLGYKDMNYSDR